MLVANEQLQKANSVIEELTAKVGELKNDLELERKKTRENLKETFANIGRVASRLRIFQERTLPPQESSSAGDILAMLNSRLCILEQNLSEQELKRRDQAAKPQSPLVIKQGEQACKTLEEALSRTREEYKLLSSDLASMRSKQEKASATLKSLDETICEKRKVLEDRHISMQNTISDLAEGLKKPEVVAPVEPKESSSSSKESKNTQRDQSPSVQFAGIEEQHLMGRALLWEFDQKAKIGTSPRKRKVVSSPPRCISC